MWVYSKFLHQSCLYPVFLGSGYRNDVLPVDFAALHAFADITQDSLSEKHLVLPDEMFSDTFVDVGARNQLIHLSFRCVWGLIPVSSRFSVDNGGLPCISE